jgi:Holliday junction resolvasome RuvABC endonuclease subunit
LNFLSIDPGKNVAIACWKDDKLVDVIKWTFVESNFHSQNLSDLIGLIAKLASDISADVIVSERPARTMPIQFIETFDVRMLAKKKKIQFVFYPAKKVKKIAAGDGNSSKDDMTSALLLKKIYSRKKIMKMNEHEVDSIMIGVCFLEDLTRGDMKIKKRKEKK